MINEFELPTIRNNNEDETGELKEIDMKDFINSTNTLLFSRSWSDKLISHIVIGLQAWVGFTIMFQPYQEVVYNGTNAYSVVLLGFIVFAAEVIKEYSDFIDHQTYLMHHSWLFIILSIPHTTISLINIILCPLVMCKTLASANFYDVVGVLSGYTGVFILFDVDGILFDQFKLSKTISNNGINKTNSILKYKRILLVVLPIILFLIFESWFIAIKGCGTFIQIGFSTTHCESIDDTQNSSPTHDDHTYRFYYPSPSPSTFSPSSAPSFLHYPSTTSTFLSS
jgi:hypothetical protein